MTGREFAVAEDVERCRHGLGHADIAHVFAAAARIGQARGQLERLQQRRGPLGRLDGLQPPVQQAAVVGKALLDPGGVGKADYHGHVARLHLVDQLAHLAFGFVQPRRLHVGGRHAGRVIDQEDEPAADQLGPLPTRPQQGPHHQKDHQ